VLLNISKVNHEYPIEPETYMLIHVEWKIIIMPYINVQTTVVPDIKSLHVEYTTVPAKSKKKINE
jgi:hypothetical protein